MGPYKQTIAFLGATGGSAGVALAYALNEGHHCTALCAPTIDEYLTIHQGDAKNALDVSRALVSPTDDKVLVDIMYSAIGAYPKIQFSFLMPFVLTDQTICEDGMATLFAAIDQLAIRGIEKSQSGQKPLFIVTSATAGNSMRRTLPLLMLPLYYYLLRQPHFDKQNMEKLLIADRGLHARDFVIIRPALLTDGVERGVQSVRAGWEWGVDGLEVREKAPGPAIGWTIGRKDLGGWVFRKVVVEGGWEGRCVSLCY